ncbi:MAG: competence/damage-inducible protein A [Alphaproteobacteria bacterium]|nr:competence/damage-inducible protein A [Alphaproteobacteria bacterium]
MSSSNTDNVQTPTAAVLIIGNEILSGRTQDVNLNAIAIKLAEIGVRLSEARIVPDIQEEIVNAVNTLRQRYTYVLTTGGIGPTHDDITADSIGAAFGLTVAENPAARDRLLRSYGAENLTPARLRMARTPVGAELIDNPVSAAPGFCVENVYVMAGVPNIMRAMLDNVVAGLKHGPKIHSVSVSGFVAESLVAAALEDIARRYGMLDIGSYPWVRSARHGTALVSRGTDQDALRKASAEILALMQQFDAQASINEASFPL